MGMVSQWYIRLVLVVVGVLWRVLQEAFPLDEYLPLWVFALVVDGEAYSYSASLYLAKGEACTYIKSRCTRITTQIIHSSISVSSNLETLNFVYVYTTCSQRFWTMISSFLNILTGSPSCSLFTSHNPPGQHLHK